MSKESSANAQKVLEKFFETLKTLFDKHYKIFLEHKRKMICDEYQFYLEWMDCYTKYEDTSKYKSTSINSSFFAPIKGKFYNSSLFTEYDPYKEIDKVWKFRYDQRLIRTLNVLSPEMKKRIIATCFLLGQGYFNRAVLNNLGPMYFTGSFYFELKARHFLVFLILPERIPRKYYEKIEGYTYSQYIRFLDIVDSPEKVDDLVKRYFKEISKKFDKCEFFLEESNCKALPFFKETRINKEDSFNYDSISIYRYNYKASGYEKDIWHEPLFFSVYVPLPTPIYIYYHKKIKKLDNQKKYQTYLEEAIKVLS